jgi:putative ABC transport system permease protein
MKAMRHEGNEALSPGWQVKKLHSMLRNYFKVAIRSLLKNKLTSAVNLLGLALGLTCVILTFAFVRYEMSFDRFHDESDRIYRIASQYKDLQISNTPPPLGPRLEEFFPEVEASLRINDGEIVIEKQSTFYKEEAHFVDPHFLQFFNFEVIKGSEDLLLAEPGDVVLSETAARKYFGNLNPLGASLEISFKDQKKNYQVRAVVADPPLNSSLQFTILLPLAIQYADRPESMENGWMNYSLTTLVRLRQGESHDLVSSQMPAFIETYMGEAAAKDGGSASDFSFGLQPFTDYHLSGAGQAGGLTPTANPQLLWILSLVALLILIVACLNFANLSNANSSMRLTEIGVRKVLGARRNQLLQQFLTESVVLSFLALLLAVVLVETSSPLFSRLLGYELPLNYFSDLWLAPVLILITVTTGLVAGGYPAFLLSRFKTIQVFRTDLKIGGYNWFTRSSIAFQFCLSIGLVACTLVVYQQQQFIKNRDLGFDEEQLLIVPTQLDKVDPEQSQRLADRYRTRVLQHAGVLGFSATSNAFTRGNRAYFLRSQDGERRIVFFYRIDDHFLSTLDMELIQGRTFRSATEVNRDNAIIVNEAFLKSFDIEDPLTAVLPDTLDHIAAPRIIGVVKDFHFQHLRAEIQPVVFHQQAEIPFAHMLIKVSPEDVAGTIAKLRHDWGRLDSGQPFEFHFMDEDIQRQYESEQRWSLAIRLGAILAIIIACMGLFALTALTVARRSKEIGIRKVLGATVAHLLVLLSRQFALLVLVANVIALPIAWYLMRRWLDNFAYRIDLDWTPFAGAGVIVLTLALVTLSFQSVRAATRNPVEALRDE